MRIAMWDGLGGKRKRRRKRRGGFGNVRRPGSSRARFKKAAKLCSRIVRKRGGSFKVCMRKHLKKGK